MGVEAKQEPVALTPEKLVFSEPTIEVLQEASTGEEENEESADGSSDAAEATLGLMGEDGSSPTPGMAIQDPTSATSGLSANRNGSKGSDGASSDFSSDLFADNPMLLVVLGVAGALIVIVMVFCACGRKCCFRRKGKSLKDNIDRFSDICSVPDR